MMVTLIFVIIVACVYCSISFSKGVSLHPSGDLKMLFHFSYVHRVGRTARAGREGYAVTFVTDNDRSLLKAIVSIGLSNAAHVLACFELYILMAMLLNIFFHPLFSSNYASSYTGLRYIDFFYIKKMWFIEFSHFVRRSIYT